MTPCTNDIAQEDPGADQIINRIIGSDVTETISIYALRNQRRGELNDDYDTRKLELKHAIRRLNQVRPEMTDRTLAVTFHCTEDQQLTLHKMVVSMVRLFNGYAKMPIGYDYREELARLTDDAMRSIRNKAMHAMAKVDRRQHGRRSSQPPR